MLTLDEAVAWLDKMLELHVKPCGEPDCGECLRDTRAAVRDVALAAVNWPTEAELESYPIGSTAETAIHAALGDLPHG
jgi:hypothetical protein